MKVNKEIESFFQDYPMTFLSRDPADEHFSGFPNTLEEARDFLLYNSFSSSIIEEQLGYKTLCQLYLFAIGDYDSTMHFLSFPEKRISELLNSGRINENSFGFITELDIKEACNLTKLSNLDSTTLNQILQFCAAHKLPISHDVTLLELRNIAHWVIKNESDNVSFTNMTTMMHQAIDLSVLGQNAQNLSHTSMRKDVNDFMELAIQKTDQMIGDQEVARGELSELFSISESSMEAKLIADFQNKVMRAHEQSKVVRDDSEQVSEPKQSSEQENDE